MGALKKYACLSNILLLQMMELYITRMDAKTGYVYRSMHTAETLHQKIEKPSASGTENGNVKI